MFSKETSIEKKSNARLEYEFAQYQKHENNSLFSRKTYLVKR